MELPSRGSAAGISFEHCDRWIAAGDNAVKEAFMPPLRQSLSALTNCIKQAVSGHVFSYHSFLKTAKNTTSVNQSPDRDSA